MLNIKLGKYTITSDASNFILGKEKQVEIVKDKVKTGEFKTIIEPISYHGTLPQLYRRFLKEEILSTDNEFKSFQEVVELIEHCQTIDVAWAKYVAEKGEQANGN